MPLFIGVKGELYFPSLKAAGVTKADWIEITADKSGDVVIADKAKLPAHDGTVWLFGHGNSDGKKGSIFHTFDEKTHKGFVFDNAKLYSFLSDTVGAKRLYIFACYQGKYLKQYMKGIKGLEFASGFDSAANRSSAGTFIKGFLKSPGDYKMDKVEP